MPITKKSRKRGAPRKRQLKQKLSLTIDPQLIAKIKRIAKSERRSVSSLIEHLIDLEWRKLKADEKHEPQDPRRDSGVYRLSKSFS